MPTYQYRCADCGSDLEVVQKFTDDALTTCPTCGGDLRKVFSAVGVVFKGSGFYATDSRKSKVAAAPAAHSTGDTTHASGESSHPAGESSPAAKEAPAPASTKPATAASSSTASDAA